VCSASGSTGWSPSCGSRRRPIRSPACSTAARSGSGACTSSLIDVDRFKQINDREGHLAGDEALVDLARELTGALREIDTLARVGGDEFAVLLPATGSEGARATAERLASITTVAISVGAAVYGVDGRTADDLGRAADAALYAAKRRVEPLAPPAR
jgi:diguanylate cyclase (GGDEF)-like protein